MPIAARLQIANAETDRARLLLLLQLNKPALLSFDTRVNISGKAQPGCQSLRWILL